MRMDEAGEENMQFLDVLFWWVRMELFLLRSLVWGDVSWSGWMGKRVNVSDGLC